MADPIKKGLGFGLLCFLNLSYVDSVHISLEGFCMFHDSKAIKGQSMENLPNILDFWKSLLIMRDKTFWNDSLGEYEIESLFLFSL